jgi:hypothetical protein
LELLFYNVFNLVVGVGLMNHSWQLINSKAEKVIDCHVPLQALEFKTEKGDGGGRNANEFATVCDDKRAGIGCKFKVDGDDDSHASLHRVVILGLSLYL